MPENMEFRFQFNRSLQSAAYLLKKADGQKLDYIHLLKLLYIADREHLAERGYMITGDRVVARQYGPVLSNTFALINGWDSQSYQWNCFISPVSDKQVRLVNDPGTGDLSKGMVSQLNSVFDRYGRLEPTKVIELTHEFPEWKNCYHKSAVTPITWQSILCAQGKEKMLHVAEEQIQMQRHMDRMQEVIHASG
jgi:uncharacterized phage-associated protein